MTASPKHHSIFLIIIPSCALIFPVSTARKRSAFALFTYISCMFSHLLRTMHDKLQTVRKHCTRNYALYGMELSKQCYLTASIIQRTSNTHGYPYTESRRNTRTEKTRHKPRFSHCSIFIIKDVTARRLGTTNLHERSYTLLHFLHLGSRFEPGNDVAVSINHKLGEIPLDIGIILVILVYFLND